MFTLIHSFPLSLSRARWLALSVIVALAGFFLPGTGIPARAAPPLDAAAAPKAAPAKPAAGEPDDGRPKGKSGKEKFEEIVDIFTVDGVKVDVRADTVLNARETALMEAQRKAWRKLWSRMSGNPESMAPGLGDSTLRAVVIGIDVIAENFSARRYIGIFSIRFDPLEVRKYSGAASGYLAARSRPLLVLPVLKDAGVTMVHDPKSVWALAWSRHALGSSLIDYVRAEGTPLDTLLLTPWAAIRRDIDVLQIAYERYRAEGLIVAFARLDRRYPGGPVVGDFKVYQGADNRAVIAFRLVARNPLELDLMLAGAINRIDAGLVERLRSGNVSYASTETELKLNQPVRSLGVQNVGGLEVALATPDAEVLTALQERIRQTRTVTSVFPVSVALGGMSLFRIANSEGLDWLIYELDRTGLRLENVGGTWRLRDRAPEDTPIERPRLPEEEQAEAAAPDAPTPEAEAAPVAPPAAAAKPAVPALAKPAAPAATKQAPVRAVTATPAPRKPASAGAAPSAVAPARKPGATGTIAPQPRVPASAPAGTPAARKAPPAKPGVRAP